jgi:hypothetical protein
MEMFWLGLAIGVAITGFLFLTLALARAGSLGRASWGLTVAGRAKADPALAAKLDALLGTAPAPQGPPLPPKPSAEPIRLLTLLQIEARLVDFLMEDISTASDEQVGQAVREIHRKGQKVLKDHITLEEVLPDPGAGTVTVPKGFDPSAVRLVGNVTGEPPFTGELQHPGWKVKEIRLPPKAEGQDPFVLQPAEVNLP